MSSIGSYGISRPSTSEDDGRPSDSCHEDVKRIFCFIEDERHLLAISLYHDVLERVRGPTDTSSPTNKGNHHRFQLLKSKSSRVRDEHAKDVKGAAELIEENQPIFNKLEERCRLFAKARENLLDENNWTLAQTLFGITTYYRREDDGSLSIKMEGHLEGIPLFDQVAVLREVDLHYTWAPFVSSSLTIAHLDKLDTVGWFVVGLPSFGLMRDACFRAIGCDSMLEDGSILLVAQGVQDKPVNGVRRTSLQMSGEDAQSSARELAKSEFEFLSQDPILDELDIPAPPTRIGSGRMTIRAFQALIHVESPTTARSSIIANVDPNLPLIPQSLLDFLMKKLCGVLLYKLQNAAKRVSKDPVHNPHASKMRSDEDFYKNWLMEKFKAVCKLRGWIMPSLAAFEMTDQQMELAQIADQKKNKGKTAKKLKFFHSLTTDKLDDFLETDSGYGSEPACVGQNSPKMQPVPVENDSVISDISRNSSSSFWTSNPVSTYIREVEEKTQLRKALEIERSRERASNRLKPKALDMDSRSRLQELRAARQRREGGIKAGQKLEIPKDLSKSQRSIIRKQHRKDWATMWTSHGPLSRSFVMLFLTTSLFGLLFVDRIFENHIIFRGGTYWLDLRQDVITVGYMSLSAAVHFCLCYVALMYAFSGLEIGAIAGRRAKQFYSKNIHLLVGIGSASTVVLGMAKASSIVFTRWMIWNTYKVYDLSACLVSNTSSKAAILVNDFLQSHAAIVSRSFGKAFSIILAGRNVLSDAVVSVVNTCYLLTINSNPVGRRLATLSLRTIQPLTLSVGAWRSFVNASFDNYEAGLQVKLWREHAFETTRDLLAYSGVFLLVLLALFAVSARSARDNGGMHRVESMDETISMDSGNSKCQSTLSEVPALQTNISGSVDTLVRSPTGSGGSRSRSRNTSRSLSPQFDTIEEASEEGAGDKPRSTGPRSQQQRATKKPRDFRLFRRRNRNQSSGAQTSSR